MLENLSTLLDKVDDKGLHDIKDLKEKEWEKVRLLAYKILKIITEKNTETNY